MSTERQRGLESTRREVLVAGLAGGLVLGGCGRGNAGVAPAAPPVKPLRVAHLTDIHVEPELRSPDGFAAALESVGKLNPPADFIITGGDHVMDAYQTSGERAKAQWDVYDRVISAGTKLPIYSAIGNHDVWGWAQPGQIKPDAPGYGKQMAMDRLRMKGKSYYSYDKGGWHFIVLDNIAQRGLNYFGDLDDEQAEWLVADLKTTGPTKPICVVSHIPLLAACVFFDGDRIKDNNWSVPDAWMHRDVKPLIETLSNYNVKLCLSGHIHLVDRVEYLGITFICDGAVCGAWWKGPYQEFDEGFGVIDFWPDGKFDYKYVPYAWKAANDERPASKR